LSEPQVIRKVVVKRKIGNNREKVGITYEELNQLKQWVLTGSFTNELCSDQNKIDFSKLYLLRRAVFSEPRQLNKILLDYSLITTKKDTLFLVLIFLSSGNFQAKKCFKESFNKIIKTPNDLYKFFSLLKRYRGMGSIIHVAVKNWFNSTDIRLLERMFVLERSKYSWSAQDVVRLIKLKPTDKKEGLLLRWLAIDGIDFNDQQDYLNYLPLVHAYETMRHRKNDISIQEMMSKLQFDYKAIPSNVSRTKSLTKKILETKNITQQLHFLKKRYRDGEAISAVSKGLDELRKNQGTLSMDVIDQLSIYEEMINNRISTKILDDMLYFIELKLKEMNRENVISIVDMNTNMYNKKNSFFGITPAVIASALSSSHERVFTFSGREKLNTTDREILEAEGTLETIKHINIDKIGKEIKEHPKNIIIWTNREYLKDLEKDVKILSMIYKKSNVCLMNMRNAKLKNRDPNYYVINGFDKNTKKLIKLVEKGMGV